MAEEHQITSLRGLEALRFGPSHYFEGADFSSPRKRGSWRFGGDYVSLPDRLKPLGDLTLQSPLECLLLRWEAARRFKTEEASEDLLDSLNKPQSTRMLIAYFLIKDDLFAALDDCPASYILFSKAAEIEMVHRRTCTFFIDKTPWVEGLLGRAKEEGRIVNVDSWLDDRYHSRLPFPLSTNADAGVSEFSTNSFCQAMFGGATVLYEALEQEYAAAGLIHLSIPWKGSLEYKSSRDAGAVEIHTVVLGGLQDSGLPVNVTNPYSKDRYSLSAVNADAFARDRGCVRGVRSPMGFANYQRVLESSLHPILPPTGSLVEILPPGSKAGLAAKPVGR